MPPDSAEFCAYIPFASEGSAFALPLFSAESRGRRYLVQVVSEYNGSVSGFVPLEDEDVDPITQVDGRFVRRGEEPLYVFCVAGGANVIAGTLNEIAAELRKYSEANGSDVQVRLQIAELIGSPEERRAARSRMRRAIRSAAGETASRSFLQSNLQRVLWEKIVSSAESEEIADQILANRRKIVATIDESGGIVADLSRLDSDLAKRIDLGRAVEEVRNELDDLSGLVNVNAGESSQKADVIRLLKKIRKIRRQEERVASLISTMLENPELGKQIIRLYGSDNGEFANWAIREVIPKCEAESEIDAEKIVDQLYAAAYPMARGIAMNAMSKYLGKHPAFREALRNKLLSSRSKYVRERDAEITENLRTPVSDKNDEGLRAES